LRVVETMRYLPRPRQPTQIPVNHQPVETAVYKQKQAARQPREHLHRPSHACSCLSNKIIGQTAGGFKISSIFGQVFGESCPSSNGGFRVSGEVGGE
jgi:hypothetical protein